MYGLVNQAIKDLVEHKFGEKQWTEICAEAKVETTDFISLQYYPDSITYSLVGAASKILAVPAEKVLELFGQYWVLYTAKEGYGPMMDLFGSDFKECLKNLNNLHSRMGMTLPQLAPPKFEFLEINQSTYQLEYISARPGLCPMVQGLLQGLAEKHKTPASISYSEESGRKIFTINILKAA